jgi:predicted transposase/invertase (TIGR01784 family)
LETAKLTPKQREFYHKSLLSYQELKGVVDTAREEGLAEGLQQGREEGRAEGREEGRAEGREEGRAEGREEGIQEGKLAGIIQVAQTMKHNGLPLQLIQQVTGLTNRELQQLERS